MQLVKKPSIRTPTRADLDSLVLIERRSFRSHRLEKEDFEYHLTNRSSIFFLVDVAGQTIGYLVGIVYHGARNRIAKLYSMAVLPGWRKRRIGSLMLEEFERQANKRGCRWATLEVRKTNRPARAMYSRFGYKEENILKDYYSRDNDAVRMRKSLSKVRGES